MMPPMRRCSCGCGRELPALAPLSARYHPFCRSARRNGYRNGYTSTDSDLPAPEIERRFAAALAQIQYQRRVQG